MDPNGGFDPNAQVGNNPQLYSAPQAQYQQAPMAGQDPAYNPSMVTAAPIPTPQIAPTPSPGQPMQDIRPGWQQDLQYSAPVDPPWVQDPTIANYGQAALVNSGIAPSPTIAPEAYSLLTEPMEEFSQTNSAKSSKNLLRTTVMVLVTLVTLAGTALGAYTMGYKKGVIQTAATAESGSNTSSQQDKPDETPQKDTESTEPELSFELTKPDYKEGVTNGVLGEQLIASDGLVVNAYKIDPDYQPESTEGAATADSFLKVDLLIGNADSTRPKTITKSAFTVVDDTGETIGPLDSESDGLDTTGTVTLSPGMKARMSLVFPVASKDSSWSLTWTQVYQVSGTQREVGVVIALASESQQSTAQSQLE